MAGAGVASVGLAPSRASWSRFAVEFLAADGGVRREPLTECALLNYPEIVTLAGLLADQRWRIIANGDHRPDRRRFEREVACRLHLDPVGFDPGDPLVAWQEGEALTRRQRLHSQPGYHGPEVWLSQPAQLHHDLPPCRTPRAWTPSASHSPGEDHRRGD